MLPNKETGSPSQNVRSERSGMAVGFDSTVQVVPHDAPCQDDKEPVEIQVITDDFDVTEWMNEFIPMSREDFIKAFPLKEKVSEFTKLYLCEFPPLD